MINGSTRVLAIIGDPVEHVRSPQLYNARIAELGADAVLVPWHARIDDFDVVMRGLMATANLAGVVVTYPYKQQAMGYARRVSAMAGHVGAVNALRREADGTWSGEMFDGAGLVRAIDERGQKVAGRRVRLIGAGGAGSAIAFALAVAGATSLSIFDNDEAKAVKVARGVEQYRGTCRAELGSREGLDGADILINATPVGLHSEDGLPVPLPSLPSSTTVVDIVHHDAGTPLLRLAERCGCPIVRATAMAAAQTDLMLSFFGILKSSASGGAAS